MTLIIAHRGFSGEYLDNSYEAFLSALQLQADMIELDIRVCGSGDLIVYHDWRIGEDLIHQQTLNYLKRKYQIMSLTDVLQIYHLYYTTHQKKVKLLLDIKTPHYSYSENTNNYIGPLVSIMQEYIEDKVINYDSFICSSFNKEILENISNLDSNINIGLITSYIDINEIDEIKNKYKYVSLYYNEITPQILSKFHENNVKLFLYTVDSSHDMNNFLEINVDGIITNFPDKLIKIINEKIMGFF